MRSTLAKSFKFGGSKETNPDILGLIASDLINLVKDNDLQVKKNTLEGLNAIVHS